MEARPLLDTRLALYYNNNNVIYLKFNIQKSSIDYKYIYWQVLFNRILLELNSRALAYGLWNNKITSVLQCSLIS